MPEALAREIDIFETEINLRRQDKVDEKIFAETRLRRGVYGQRYDNGQRHDGARSRVLEFPQSELKKGPDTVWDAPGMMRIKIPMGRLTADQLDCLAELAEEYSDGILHVTTRQDIQLHFVHIEDTPDLMRRLAAVGITTREACGNSVRNVTACQFAGVCKDQAFDVSPYAQAMAYFLLGHKDAQDFGRKFKISFSGCATQPCGLARIHDIGCVAVTKKQGEKEERGFAFYVGGGLGAVPYQAKLFDPFVKEEELLPLAQAVCRVFARLGERKNRARARLKFVVQKLGIDEFRRLVLEEQQKIPKDDRWTAYLDDLDVTNESPKLPGEELVDEGQDPGFTAWMRSNARPQPQAHYSVATVRLPLGDFTSSQARELSDLARRFTGDTLCLTVEQNLSFRYMPDAKLPAFYEAIRALGLHGDGAGSITDITACPGTDTCKLGISSSRGLAAVLESRLGAQDIKPEVRALSIKASGCFNSCAQHHVADLGFLGVSRNVRGRRVAHFQLVVGGERANNGGAYGLAIGAFPAKRIPEVVDRVTAFWTKERNPEERLQSFIQRIGRAKLKLVLDDLRNVPEYEADPSFYTDWGDAREYTIGDMGVGECAGEVVSFAEFGLQNSEREVFEAQLQLESGAPDKAAGLAYQAMLSAAKALIQVQNIDISDDPNQIVSEFKTRFDATKLFHDRFAGGKFGSYLIKTHENPLQNVDLDTARRQIEQAHLFIEAAHACYDRMQEQPMATA